MAPLNLPFQQLLLTLVFLVSLTTHAVVHGECTGNGIYKHAVRHRSLHAGHDHGARPQGTGTHCYISNGTAISNGNSSDWGEKCPNGLECLVLDCGQDGAGCAKSPDLGSMPGMDDGMDNNTMPMPGMGHTGTMTGLHGFCFNASLAPTATSGASSGGVGSKCTLGASNSSSGGCLSGLTCVANLTNPGTAVASRIDATQVPGICSNATQLLNLLKAAGLEAPPPSSTMAPGSSNGKGTSTRHISPAAIVAAFVLAVSLFFPDFVL